MKFLLAYYYSKIESNKQKLKVKLTNRINK